MKSRYIVRIAFLFSLFLSMKVYSNEQIEIAELYDSYFQEKGDSKTLESLSDYSQKIRDYAPSFHEQLISDLNNERPLFGLQLTNLHKLLSVYLDIQMKLLGVTNSVDFSVHERVESGLMAYHNFQKVYLNIYHHHKLRRYLNDEDSSYNIKRHHLYESLMTLLSWEQRNRVEREIQSSQDSQISLHPAYGLVLNEPLIKELTTLYGELHLKDLRNDRLVDLTDTLSGWFGNTVGAVRWRKGYLYQDEELNQEILRELRPLDIITEKTYFALTDKFIPGHFGHNAIWLGTKEELIELGMWFHPRIIPYHAQIERGESILEVDRTGTHLKSLKDFMNVDEFAILRLSELAMGELELDFIYDVALSQMGKIYDFNFDVQTTDKLVCSELLYQSFGHLNWPTEKLLNRITISPDNVASLALHSNSPVDLVYFVAEKRRLERRYKNKVDLASDIGMMHKDGIFFTQQKVCKQTSRGKRCQNQLKELIYEGHSSLPDDLPVGL